MQYFVQHYGMQPFMASQGAVYTMQNILVARCRHVLLSLNFTSKEVTLAKHFDSYSAIILSGNTKQRRSSLKCTKRAGISGGKGTG